MTERREKNPDVAKMIIKRMSWARDTLIGFVNQRRGSKSFKTDQLANNKGNSSDALEETDNPRSQIIFEDRTMDVGYNRNKVYHSDMTLNSVEIKFREDSRWRIVFPDLKKKSQKPQEALTVIYWGKDGMWMDVQRWPLYKVPKTSIIQPCAAWCVNAHQEFSPIFREVVVQYLLVAQRLKVPKELVLFPLHYLSDFVSVASGPQNSASFIVDICQPFPKQDLTLKLGDATNSRLYVADNAIRATARLEALNSVARESLVAGITESVRPNDY